MIEQWYSAGHHCLSCLRLPGTIVGKETPGVLTQLQERHAYLILIRAKGLDPDNGADYTQPYLRIQPDIQQRFRADLKGASVFYQDAALAQIPCLCGKFPPVVLTGTNLADNDLAEKVQPNLMAFVFGKQGNIVLS